MKGLPGWVVSGLTLARRHAPWTALLLGALQVLAFPPLGVFTLGVLTTAGLFLLLDEGTPRRAGWVGFGFGVGLFTGGTWWIYTAVHEFGKAPAPLALLLLGGLVGIMATWYWLFGYVSRRWLARPGVLRWLVVLPGLWVLIEYARSRALTGFPWLALGYAQIDTWLSGYAPVAGVYLVSLAAAVCAGAVVAILRGGKRTYAIGVGVVAAVALGGLALQQVPWTAPSGKPFTVAIVQGSVPQDLKWSPEQRDATFALYRRMSAPVWGDKLVVWPEAALPVLAEQAGTFLNEEWATARAKGSTLVLGLLSYNRETDAIRNGMVVLEAGEPQWYFKRHLVPFGEYFPVPPTVRQWMRLSSMAFVDLQPGEEGQKLQIAAGVPVAATICYEDAYGADQLSPLGEAQLLLNVTNNAWYGDSSAPHQHLQIARMRALEAGRYLVRATSNGISVVVGPDGRVSAQAPQFVPAVLRTEVVPYSGLTPYAWLGGDWLVLLLAAAAALVGVWRRPLSL